MSVSKLNKNITIKVSNILYEYLVAFSKKFDVSISSFCQHSVTKYILDMDSKLDNDPSYAKRESLNMKYSYDLRRK